MFMPILFTLFRIYSIQARKVKSPFRLPDDDRGAVYHDEAEHQCLIFNHRPTLRMTLSRAQRYV